MRTPTSGTIHTPPESGLTEKRRGVYGDYPSGRIAAAGGGSPHGYYITTVTPELMGKVHSEVAATLQQITTRQLTTVMYSKRDARLKMASL